MKRLSKWLLILTLVIFNGCGKKTDRFANQIIEKIDFNNMKYPYQEKSFEYEGNRVVYLDHGQGDPLIFLHGQASDLLNFEPVFPLFDETYRVIAIDYPGFGKSDKPEIQFTEKFYSGLIDQLFIATGIESATLIGHSYGGLISMIYATARPQRIKSLVLISPAGIQKYSAFIEKAIRGSFTVEAIMATTVEKSLKNYQTIAINRTPDVERYATRRAGLLKNAGEDYCRYAHAMVQAADLMFKTNVRDRIGAHNFPTLLIWGREDPLIPYKIAAETLEYIPHAELITIDKCGHFPMLEYPDKFYELINAYLRVQS
ncbi:MAG: alpha/beta hydrolase [Candidatus Marinimicrobia bacterium]|nr:alpha/beta hydrolase [Candidatus Neomarinimicrobiota bacterium]